MTQRYSFLMLKRAVTRGDGQQSWYASGAVTIEERAGALGIRITDERGVADFPAADVAYAEPILEPVPTESSRPFAKATEILKKK